MLISTGSNKNENPQTCESSTQRPKTYLFNYHGIDIRLIDTPGLGDTRRIERDQENFQNILIHISKYDYYYYYYYYYYIHLLRAIVIRHV